MHGIAAKLKNAYLAGIGIVTHEKVFHLENQVLFMKKGINLMLTLSTIQISDNPRHPHHLLVLYFDY